MCTAKDAPCMKAGAALLPAARHHSSSGGSSDTEVKEFAVTPTGSPSGRTAVTTVTPVANSPNASRRSRCVNELLKRVTSGSSLPAARSALARAQRRCTPPGWHRTGWFAACQLARGCVAAVKRSPLQAAAAATRSVTQSSPPPPLLGGGEVMVSCAEDCAELSVAET